jgi:L-ascorbate metabolism protein UlaG (beta-lactamase superfamily)
MRDPSTGSSAVLGLATLAAVATSAMLLAPGCFEAPRYRGPVSDHFDGDGFHTPGAPTPAKVSDFFRWQLSRKPGRWRDYTNDPPGPPPPRRVAEGELRVTFINHATTLIQIDGLNVLTDPIWSERTSPVSFAGPKRRRPPGLRFRDLPPIDLVIISHNHYDHLDMPTLRRLARQHRPFFFAGLGNAALFEREGIPGGRELDWWQTVELASRTLDGRLLGHRRLRVTSVPVQHFSNRGVGDVRKTLWTGYVIEGPHGRVYFGGDTAYGPHFAAARRRLGPMRVAILPIGAYKPEWFMGPIHMSPRQAVLAARDLGAAASVPMHYGTFHLADDGETEALDDLRAALKVAPEPRPRFVVLGFGEGQNF